MNIYDATVPQLSKMLRNLDAWLAAAIAFAEKKKFPVDNFVTARLAPDQYAFARQVQSACDSAKLLAARLTGNEAPVHADTETTIDQLRARIATVVAYLGTLKPDDFAGADDRKITLPFLEGKWMTGAECATEWGLPNFYFHVVNAYEILRQGGVDLGKRAFIGSVPMRA